MPEITVLMPVHNGGKFLRPAIASILQQTLTEFEFVIIDDASSDETDDVVRQFSDSRIRYFRNEQNLGVAQTLNKGLDLANGDYIVRADADDISLPGRIEQQVQFMDAHPAIGVSGSRVRLFGDELPVVNYCPIGADVVKAYLLLDNPLFHPSAILRKEMLDKHNLRYDPQFTRSEDFDLWSRAAGCFEIDNVPEVLVRVRCHTGNVTSRAIDAMTRQSEMILVRNLKKLGIDLTEQEAIFHHCMSRGRRVESELSLARAEKWFLDLKEKNLRNGLFSPDAFAVALGMVWFRLCRNSAPVSGVWKIWKRSKLNGYYSPTPEELGPFLLSIIWHRLHSKFANREAS
ncbi:MAG: glycosyltransferase family 2 protein [Pseudomonadota bacterium]